MRYAMILVGLVLGLSACGEDVDLWNYAGESDDYYGYDYNSYQGALTVSEVTFTYYENGEQVVYRGEGTASTSGQTLQVRAVSEEADEQVSVVFYDVFSLENCPYDVVRQGSDSPSYSWSPVNVVQLRDSVVVDVEPGSYETTPGLPSVTTSITIDTTPLLR